MKFKFNIKMICLAVQVLSITGCSFTMLPSTVNKSIKKIDNGIGDADHKLSMAHNISHENFNHDVDGVFLGNSVVYKKDSDFLPMVFNNQVQIDSSFYSMTQVADTLNRITKYPVLLDVDASRDVYFRVTQSSGNLVELLNNICAKTDTMWSYKDGKIVISELETRTWFLKSLPGDVQVQNQVNSASGMQSQSGGSGGGGGSQSSGTQAQNNVQNIQFNLANSLWENIQTSVKSMLSKRGSVNIMPSTSSIAVTDKPSVIVKVDNFIKKQNEMLKRQVQIDVQILQVETNAEDNYGINWNVILKDVAGSISINGQPGVGGGPSPSDGKSLTGMVPIFTPNTTTQAFTFGAGQGELNGSQLLINALSTVAKTALINSTAATTLNNQPVPVQVVEQQGYVASITTTMGGGGTGGATTQTAINPGQISYGFVLNILPNVEDSGLVNLQISLNLSSLKKMTNFTSGGATVQLPDMYQRNTMQKVTMRSGDTYVLTGFDSDLNEITNTGVGGATMWLFGGGVNASKTRSRFVLLVTPRVINI